MTVADMPEDHVIQSARIQCIFVKSQERRKTLVRNGHVRPDLSLTVTGNVFIHRNRQSMAEYTHLLAVLFVRRKPRTLKIGVMLFEQFIPLFEQRVFGLRRCFLLKKDRPCHSQWRFGKSFGDKLESFAIKVLDQRCVKWNAAQTPLLTKEGWLRSRRGGSLLQLSQRERKRARVIDKSQQIGFLFNKHDTAKKALRL